MVRISSGPDRPVFHSCDTVPFGLWLQDLKRALELDPSDKAIDLELKRCKRAIAEQNKKEKGMFAKMMKALSAEDKDGGNKAPVEAAPASAEPMETAA